MSKVVIGVMVVAALALLAWLYYRSQNPATPSITDVNNIAANVLAGRPDTGDTPGTPGTVTAGLDTLAATQGMDRTQMYQAHLVQSIQTEGQEIAAAQATAQAKGFQLPPQPPPGAPPAAPNQNLYATLAAAGPDTPQPPGTYWDYGTNSWQPLLV